MSLSIDDFKAIAKTRRPTVNEYVNLIVTLRAAHGFVTTWDNFAEKAALIHAELGRATDANRDNNSKLATHELTDTLIRLLDLMGSIEIDVEKRLNHQLTVWSNTRLNKGPKHGKRY